MERLPTWALSMWPMSNWAERRRAGCATRWRSNGRLNIAVAAAVRMAAAGSESTEARSRSAAAPQQIDILLKGAGGKRVALLQQGDAAAGEIEAAVARMRNQPEGLELFARHALGMNEVAHIDQIGLEQGTRIIELLVVFDSEVRI